MQVTRCRVLSGGETTGSELFRLISDGNQVVYFYIMADMGRVNNHIDYVEFPAKDVGELEKVKEFFWRSI